MENPAWRSIGLCLDRIIAIALAITMMTIATGYMLLEGFDPFWVFYLSIGLVLPVLLSISHPATLAAFAFLAVPGSIIAYVVCNVYPSNAALDVHHQLHESPLAIVMFGYGATRCMWELIWRTRNQSSVLN